MDELEVEFQADTGGTFPMTWGQQGIWAPIRLFGDGSSFFNLPVVVDLPGDVAAADQAVFHHQVLRGKVEALCGARQQKLPCLCRGPA